mmetsp:Transcript_6780/g.9932  ORF Transcript_6780/g.9932 Transcript_6780/m.9932 type:complete len:542 (-) Transcript_6780:50-1675(-)|eukprot:CAMPEP_0196820526 /NCGR_PEP_ID=MMETSP1362-20130617/75665_1 /TAXON_ID=163516 /ORGANISM="Leptocylindrus danicus, Strain CCMP1856" /LENGTH=541 /DNA_ID=CAMNT_0042199447 /DNA_START=97 /DNA_END=1722 /DNA_ORIENTATION=+
MRQNADDANAGTEAESSHIIDDGENMLFDETEEDDSIYSHADDEMTTGEVFPYRKKFAVKVTLLLLVHVVALLVAALVPWTRWHVSFEDDMEGVLIVDYYEENDLFMYLDQFSQSGLYEVYAMYVIGTLIQPMLRVMAFAFVQYAFYEGMGVKWHPRPGVDYATSCDEKKLLPWLGYHKRTLSSIPGRMKFATGTLDFLEHSIRLSSAQSCVNALMTYNFTTKTSNGGTTSSNGNSYFVDTWPEIRAGFIAVNVFNIAGLAGLVLMRWELNRWIRWYKRKNSNTSSHVTSQFFNISGKDGSHIADAGNGETLFTEPLLQRDASNGYVEESPQDVDNGRETHHDKVSSWIQTLWYIAAAGSVISWSVVASGAKIFDFHHTTEPFPGDSFPYSRDDSIYDFLYYQLSYTHESLFFFQIMSFSLIVIVCFVIPTLTMYLCLAIELSSRYDYLDTLMFRELVCTLQYLRLCVGSESFLFAMIFFYLEIERISKNFKSIDFEDTQLFMTTDPEIVWATGFFISWMVFLWALNDLTLTKYKWHTLEI